MENHFFVPTHQRDYRWELEEVAQLFDDLDEAMNRGDSFYFIGLMVFMHAEDGRLRVLDGQQRLATAIIILSAVRAWFGSTEGGQATVSQIQNDFIGRPELGETRLRPRLTLNFNNDDIFQKYVVSGSPVAEIRKERNSIHKHAPNFELLDAIAYCHERVNKIAERDGDRQKTSGYLIGLAKYIRDSVIVVRLTVPNEANAFRVFQTLNDRGLDLSAFDLLKNYLFGLAYDQSASDLRQIEMRWAQITQTLSGVSQEDFLKVFWTSRNGKTQLDIIFDEVREQCKTAQEATDLSIDLLESAEYYAALETSDDPAWAKYLPQSRELLSSLRLLGSKQVKPVILSAVKVFDVNEFDRLLRLLEVLVVRYQLIGEGRTGGLEISFSRLAQQIYKGTITTASDALRSLADIMPNDSVFHDTFAKKENLSNQKAVYVLKKLEKHERQLNKGGHGQELTAGSVTLEHILPKTPCKTWIEVVTKDPEIIGDCVSRLGNLCLITETKNREAADLLLMKKDSYTHRAIYSQHKKLHTTTSGTDNQLITDKRPWQSGRSRPGDFSKISLIVGRKRSSA
jgi:hypothetical protein